MFSVYVIFIEIYELCFITRRLGKKENKYFL